MLIWQAQSYFLQAFILTVILVFRKKKWNKVEPCIEL